MYLGIQSLLEWQLPALEGSLGLRVCSDHLRNGLAITGNKLGVEPCQVSYHSRVVVSVHSNLSEERVYH